MDAQVTLPSATLGRYGRFSLYNSPYPAHDHGCAIDLYPDTNEGYSPVSGEILETRTVRAPPKPYAPEHDHLILIDVDADAADAPTVRVGDETRGVDDHRDDAGVVARVLHVDPAVEPGDYVAVGDSLGQMVRAGFFAPWVGNHVHLGFRDPESNLYRANGSLPVGVDVAVEPLAWDGRGTVVETGETYVVLDEPAHPASGEHFVGIGDDAGRVALDGGLVHYGGGGALGGSSTSSLELLGETVGLASGRDVEWADVAIRANDERITGLSLFASRESFGAKLVCPGHGFVVGDEVRVAIDPDPDPIRLD